MTIENYNSEQENNSFNTKKCSPNVDESQGKSQILSDKKKIKQYQLSLCANCQRCFLACPTSAIINFGEIDARRCLNFWTIEAPEPEKSSVPLKIQQALKKNQLFFGCEICQTVCPCNQISLKNEHLFLSEIQIQEISKGSRQKKSLSESDIQSMSDLEFRQAFRNTVFERLGRTRFLRNIELLKD